MTTCKGFTFPTATRVSRHPQHTMTRFQCIESQCWIQRCAYQPIPHKPTDLLVHWLVPNAPHKHSRISLRHCNRQHRMQCCMRTTNANDSLPRCKAVRQLQQSAKTRCRLLLSVAVLCICKLLTPQMHNWSLHRCSTVQCRRCIISLQFSILRSFLLFPCTNVLSWSA